MVPKVLTPDGPVAIETLREGDLVIARNEDTGVSGVFPVTAVMGRQASEVLWLTLENTGGEVTRMGVTPTHPLFIAGTGWGEAGALVPGDAIRDKDLQPLTVLAVEVDPKPQMVHNLEIADAHTYFAGELEAWGHNISLRQQRRILTYILWWKNRGKCGATGSPIPPPTSKLVPPADRGTLEHNPSQSRGGRDGFGKNTCYKGRENSRYGNRDETKPQNPNSDSW